MKDKERYFIMFTADWCNPCRQMKQDFQQSNLLVKYIDVDELENKELLTEYNIMGVPTVILCNEKDEELERFIGQTEFSDLLTAYKQTI